MGLYIGQNKPKKQKNKKRKNEKNDSKKKQKKNKNQKTMGLYIGQNKKNKTNKKTKKTKKRLTLPRVRTSLIPPFCTFSLMSSVIFKAFSHNRWTKGRTSVADRPTNKRSSNAKHADNRSRQCRLVKGAKFPSRIGVKYSRINFVSSVVLPPPPSPHNYF